VGKNPTWCENPAAVLKHTSVLVPKFPGDQKSFKEARFFQPKTLRGSLPGEECGEKKTFKNFWGKNVGHCGYRFPTQSPQKEEELCPR